MKNVKNKITVKTSSGNEISVVSGLRLTKRVNLDGHVVEQGCCEQTFEFKFNGEDQQTSGLITHGYPRMVKGHKILAEMGRFHLLDQHVVDAIQEVIAKTEAHPVWVEKQALIAKNQKEIAEMETSRAASGYCHKCGSYCYGDCEA